MIVIAFYLIYSFGTDLLNRYLAERELLTIQRLSMVNGLFTIVEFTCFSLFFYYTLSKLLLLRKTILIIIPLFTIFCSANLFLQFDKYDNLDTIPVTFQAIFIMSLCIIFFFEQIRNPNDLFIYSTSEFWIVTGILIFLAGTFFIFIYSSSLTGEEFEQYWPINNIFNTIKNLIFGIAVLIHGNKQKKNKKDFMDYQSILENP